MGSFKIRCKDVKHPIQIVDVKFWWEGSFALEVSPEDLHSLLVRRPLKISTNSLNPFVDVNSPEIVIRRKKSIPKNLYL
jgi:hypothetical protein